jgi:hypothetical protein
MGCRRSDEREKQMSADTPPNPGLLRFLPAVTRTLGAGVAAGITALTGDTVAGAAAGQALAEVGAEFSQRILSPRQERRVGTVIALAAAAVTANEVLGQAVRDDGFFDGDHSAGEEVIEGILLAAMQEHEERKLPYVANMLANIAGAEIIDRHTANWLISRVESLKWLEIQLIAIVGNRDKYPLPDTEIQNAKPRSWLQWTIHDSLRALIDRDSILAHSSEKEEGPLRLPKYDLRFNALILPNSGSLIYGTMELDTVPRGDLEDVYSEILTLAAASPEGDAGETDDRVIQSGTQVIDGG